MKTVYIHKTETLSSGKFLHKYLFFVLFWVKSFYETNEQTHNVAQSTAA